MPFSPPVPPPIAPAPPRARSRRRTRPRRRPIRRETSAGGVVVRRTPDAWLVAVLRTVHKRGQVWVLPKGHVELHQGEKVADAARREVQEEAGIQELSVKNQLGVSRFTFQAERAQVHKTVHYFLMVTEQENLTPQAEEGLIDAQWFPIDQAITELAYDTDQEIVRRAKQVLTSQTSLG